MKNKINSILLIGLLAVLSTAANAQSFTNNYRGFIGKTSVKFTLTFDSTAATIKGFYTKSKISTKRRVSGTCERAKDTTEAENNIICELKEFSPKTKKEIGRLTFQLTDAIDETWWFNGGKSTAKIILKKY